MLILAITISLGGVIDKGIFYFKIIGFVMAILTIWALFGITAYLVTAGFFPKKQIRIDDTDQWKETDETHFSILTVCGTIMLCIYIVPMIMRPIDFLQNFTAYILGMITYIFMLPTFINIMQIFSMANLHDVSWGNRPTTPGGEAGTNMLAENAAK